MASKTPVLTSKAPKPLPGIYSQAIKANGMVFCSGAVPMDAETGKLIDGDIQAHTVSLSLVHYPNPASLSLFLFLSFSLSTTNHRPPLTLTAQMHRQPQRHPYSRRLQPRQGGQSQRLPLQHGRLRPHERSLHDLLGRREALPHVSILALALSLFPPSSHSLPSFPLFPLPCMQSVQEATDQKSWALTGWPRCVAVKTLPLNTDVEIECMALQ